MFFLLKLVRLFDVSTSIAVKGATLICLLAISVVVQGCAFLSTAGNSGSPVGKPVTLEEMINGMTPMPPGINAITSDANEDPVPVIDNIQFDPSGEPILRTGYKVRVAVVVVERVEVEPTEVMISDKEEIALPMVGKVSCSGITLNGLRSRLTTLFSEFFRNPEVTVSFVIDDGSPSPWGQVYVQGKVRFEGWVNIPATRYLTVSRAIQLAGGFTPTAHKGAIRVHRRDENGKLKELFVDLNSIGVDGKIEEDIQLKPNDIVYVRESRI